MMLKMWRMFLHARPWSLWILCTNAVIYLWIVLAPISPGLFPLLIVSLFFSHNDFKTSLFRLQRVDILKHLTTDEKAAGVSCVETLFIVGQVRFPGRKGIIYMSYTTLQCIYIYIIIYIYMHCTIFVLVRNACGTYPTSIIVDAFIFSQLNRTGENHIHENLWCNFESGSICYMSSTSSPDGQARLAYVLVELQP